MTPLVLIHGGGLDSRCWERLVPHLESPVLAVDLPGRGAHPAPRDAVGFEECATSVRDDIDAAGFDSVVLVGHSLAGCSMPAMVALLGERVRGMVFVACTVPEDGRSAFDTLDPDIQAMIRDAGEPLEPGPMDPALAKVVLGNDLDEEQFAWCAERLVPEAARLSTDPVDLSPLRGTDALHLGADIAGPDRGAGQAVAVRRQRRQLPGRGHRCRSHVHGQPAGDARRHPQPLRYLSRHRTIRGSAAPLEGQGLGRGAPLVGDGGDPVPQAAGIGGNHEDRAVVAAVES